MATTWIFVVLPLIVAVVIVPLARAMYPENRPFVTALMILLCIVMFFQALFEQVLRGPIIAVELAIAVLVFFALRYIRKNWPPVLPR